ncbi:LysM peptidoglycan-binding domain-containing protein [Mycoplasmatota bacterium WC44]
MIFHIVKQNETVKDLIFKYGLDKSEIISNNRHISDWDMLIPGVKLKIPIVNNNLYEHLEEVEPFIEDYYQKESYNINEPEYGDNEANLVGDNQKGNVTIPTEQVNQMGDISIPQTGDISPISEEVIQTDNDESLSEEVVEYNNISVNLVSEEPKQYVQYQEVVETNDSELEYQTIDNTEVKPIMQINNTNYPTYYYRATSPYYRVIYYDPYRRQYFYY